MTEKKSRNEGQSGAPSQIPVKVSRRRFDDVSEWKYCPICGKAFFWGIPREQKAAEVEGCDGTREEGTPVCRKCGRPAAPDATVRGSHYCEEHIQWAEQMVAADEELGRGFGNGGEGDGVEDDEPLSCERCGEVLGDLFYEDISNGECICPTCIERSQRARRRREKKMYPSLSLIK